MSSESWVQQGDPVGPLLFALVLQRIIFAVDIDVECIQILFHAWFLDDEVLAGTKSAVLQMMRLIEELCPLGIFINLAKCELFIHNELSSTFPVVKKRVLRFHIVRYSGFAQSSLLLGTRLSQSYFLN